MNKMSRDQVARTLPVILLSVALFLSGGAAYGYARSAPGPSSQTRLGSPGISQASPVSTDQTPTPPLDENEVTQVSKQLYCPLCTGVRLDNCDLPLCDQMRDMIRRKLGAGETQEDIKAYFVDQYGQTVLGVPPKRGGMILAWALPFVVVLVAGGWVYRVAQRRTGQREAGDAESTLPQPLPAKYVERLERELKQFE